MINSITDVSLRKNTKKTWKEWILLLNEAGASTWTHQEIVSFLKTEKQSLWWQQMIANGYEVATGKRVEGQNLKGTYSATVTKSVSFGAKDVWKWLASDVGIQYWLKPMESIELSPGVSFEISGGIYGEIRTVKVGGRVRLTWTEESWNKPTVVQIFVYAKGKNKSMVVIQHDGILRARQKAELRAYWREIIDGISTQIPGSK